MVESSMDDKGELYLLKNQCMPGYYKIGLTRIGVESRIRTLRSTALPHDFECIGCWPTDHCLQMERHVHKLLARRRANGAREFFSFPDDHSAIGHVQGAVDSFVPVPYSDKVASEVRAVRAATASGDAKRAGLKSLIQVSKITGQSRQTLENWHRYKPDLFRIVILGCATELKNSLSG